MFILLSTLALVILLCICLYKWKAKRPEQVSKADPEQVVLAIASNLVGEIGGPHVKPPENDKLILFKDIYDLDTEIGSGASFQQYFVWATPEKIKQIVSQLESLELYEHAQITQAAIDVAFPNGVPNSYSEKENEIDTIASSEDQRGEKLEHHYNVFAKVGHLTQPLYDFVVAHKIMEMERFTGMFR